MYLLLRKKTVLLSNYYCRMKEPTSYHISDYKIMEDDLIDLSGKLLLPALLIFEGGDVVFEAAGAIIWFPGCEDASV